MGLSKQTISAYKNGTRKLKASTIKAIAQELKVSETWLLGYDVPKNDVSGLIRFSPEDYNSNELDRLMRADPDTLDGVQRQAVEKYSKQEYITALGFLESPDSIDQARLFINRAYRECVPAAALLMSAIAVPTLRDNSTRYYVCGNKNRTRTCKAKNIRQH
mgnify:FL=1|jgi:transcriptional regulator with XRE-family HTH domain